MPELDHLDVDPDAVYYDAQSGDYFTVDIDGGDEDEVKLHQYGAEYSETLGCEEFRDAWDDFWAVPPFVVNNPESVVQTALAERAADVSFDEALAINFAKEFTEITPAKTDDE